MLAESANSYDRGFCMHGFKGERFVEERVTLLTRGERIEGTLFHGVGVRLSDFLNSSIQQESTYVKIKNPTVRCRDTGETLDRASFAMVARDQIVILLMHEPEGDMAPMGAAKSEAGAGTSIDRTGSRHGSTRDRPFGGF
jgi:hypothetical protein